MHAEATNIIYEDVNREVSRANYPIRFYIIRMTYPEALTVTALTIIAWFGTDFFGLSRVPVLFTFYDPLIWAGTLIGGTLSISLAHIIAPRAKIDRMLRGAVARRRFTPRAHHSQNWYVSGNGRRWRPNFWLRAGVGAARAMRRTNHPSERNSGR